jgi:hypothetical protein
MVLLTELLSWYQSRVKSENALSTRLMSVRFIINMCKALNFCTLLCESEKVNRSPTLTTVSRVGWRSGAN